VKQVGREFGVRYVLEGSVRKGGIRVRITTQLIDAESGSHLWADRFDGPVEDVFELQDSVANSVAGVIEPTLQAAEVRRSVERPTNDLTAYDLYLRAFQYSRSWQRDDIIRALGLLEQAIARDPQYGSAPALAAYCHVMLWINGWTVDLETSQREGIELARRAIRAVSSDPCALGMAAYVFGNLGEDIDAAIALVDRALEMNPSYAGGWYYSGWLRLWAGQSENAISHFASSSRLSPYEMPPGVLLGIGIGQFFARLLTKPEQHCSALYKSFRLGHRTTAFLLLAVRRWGVWRKRAKSLGGFDRLRPSSCRLPRIGVIRSSASFTYLACG